jgi:hypothetical protein
MIRGNRKLLSAGTIAALWLGIGAATAGPCTEQLDRLARALNDPTGKAMGTLAGSAPGGIEHQAPMPKDEPAAGPTGKEAGTLAGATPDAVEGAVDPAGGRATSAQDVRLQQQGLPTMAQGGNPRAADDRLNQTRAAFDRARELDQRGDQGCMTAVEEAERLMRTGE